MSTTEQRASIVYHSTAIISEGAWSARIMNDNDGDKEIWVLHYGEFIGKMVPTVSMEAGEAYHLYFDPENGVDPVSLYCYKWSAQSDIDRDTYVTAWAAGISAIHHWLGVPEDKCHTWSGTAQICLGFDKAQVFVGSDILVSFASPDGDLLFSHSPNKWDIIIPFVRESGVKYSMKVYTELAALVIGEATKILPSEDDTIH